MRTQIFVPRPNAMARPFAANPFGDFDRLFDQFWRGFGAPVLRSATPDAHAPRMDYSIDDDEIRIRAEMPGLDEKQIEVSLEEGVLTIKGGHTGESEEKDEEKGYHHVETFRGSYRRAIRLPAEVDEDAVKADYKGGILTVTLPKLPEAKPELRTIPVTTR